jgi:hypothetical protein
MKTSLYAGAAIAGLAGLFALYSHGHRSGYAASDAAHNTERLARIEAGRKLENDRRRIAQERDQLARQLEEDAHEAPVLVPRCLDPERVRRLNTLR